ncbi:c-type cytochrome, partial [Aphanothece microscopica]|uniref:c-type cytochrome n=1 Tax=Aphanothece microscopica TaxID=1049561 RepID=UPI003CE5A10E
MVQFPGTRGGAEWGGPSFDPKTGILYVNANEVPLLLKMKQVPATPKEESTLTARGAKLYTLNNCGMCHGADRAGSDVYPSLQNIGKRRTKAELSAVLTHGKGQMPAYQAITGKDKDALLAFLGDENRLDQSPQPGSDDTSPRYV